MMQAVFFSTSVCCSDVSDFLLFTKKKKKIQWLFLSFVLSDLDFFYVKRLWKHIFFEHTLHISLHICIHCTHGW